MTLKLQRAIPCVIFFAHGRIGSGLLVLLMQCSLVLWPVANRMRRNFEERSGVQFLLLEFSQKYELPPDKTTGAKRLRQIA